MTNYIIYHEVKAGVPCPDGLMAAAIARLACPDSLLIGDSYRNEADYGDTPDVPELRVGFGDRLIIVDFSYPASWLHRWQEAGIEVTLIDHHAPKFPMLSGFSGAILNADECGATLTWQYLFGDRPAPAILKHVRRRDIGADGYYKATANCRDSKAITAAMSTLRHELAGKDIEKAIALCHQWLELDTLEDLELMGESILIAEDRQVAAIARYATTAFFCAHPLGRMYRVGKIYLKSDEERLTSQVGNAIAQNPEFKFAWIVGSESNSLRSYSKDGDCFDVSAIASLMGGGGHKAAAGWKDGDRSGLGEWIRIKRMALRQWIFDMLDT